MFLDTTTSGCLYCKGTRDNSKHSLDPSRQVCWDRIALLAVKVFAVICTVCACRCLRLFRISSHE